MKVHQLRSPRSGNPVANQFEVQTDDAIYLQSYSTVVARKRVVDGGVVIELDPAWDCSRTTTKYVCQWMDMNSGEIRKRIKDGTFIECDLNPR